MGAPLVGTAPIFAISFYSNAMGQKIQQRDRAEVLGPHQLALAGGFSGVMTTIVMAPGERIKCLLQVGWSDVVRSEVRQTEVRSMKAEDKSELHICVSWLLAAGWLCPACNDPGVFSNKHNPPPTWRNRLSSPKL